MATEQPGDAGPLLAIAQQLAVIAQIADGWDGFMQALDARFERLEAVVAELKEREYSRKGGPSGAGRLKRR